MSLTIEDMAVFCKKKGFVYPNSEIYGGLAGFFDFGPLGVELKNNIKNNWWKYNVQNRPDIVGIDGSIIANRKIWQASGHENNFVDLILTCSKCSNKLRADHLIEEELKITTDDLNPEDIKKLIKEKNLKCPKCKSQFEDPKSFNLMFATNIGSVENEDSLAYLRPETAQLIFSNFKNVVDTSRLKLPFGIAQIGKAFRNEISPRSFLFRCREFEQMEIEFFVHPKKLNTCTCIKEVYDYKVSIYSAEMQKKKQKEKVMTIKEALDKKIIKTGWLAYWLAKQHRWLTYLSIDEKNLRLRQHGKEELAHYSSDCWDLEYKFPFGWEEVQGIADRSNFDLEQHQKHSKKDLSIFDEESKEKIIPYVAAEPSFGLERVFLVFMFEAYSDDKKRGNVVLRLDPQLAPVKVGIFPLVKNKENVLSKAEEVYEMLRKNLICNLDISGSVGRRYARADEQGTPYCCTIDFESVENNDVTIRNRDDTKQVRVKIDDLKEILEKLIKKDIAFKDLK